MTDPQPSPIASSGLLPEAPSWPGPVGTTSVVWGGLSLTCAGCGVVGMLSPIFMGSMMQQAFPDGMPPGLTNPPITIWVSIGVGSLLNLFLITCGIVLLLRKPIARPMHLGYALVALLIGLVGLWFNIQYQNELAQWNRDNPNTRWAQQQAAAGTSVIKSLALGFSILLGFAWPLFCLAWFTAIKPDASEISRGADTLV